MAKANEVIDNPVTGTRITFLKTARDTDHALLQMDYLLTPYARKGYKDTHVHPHQEERLTILSGTLNYTLDGREYTAGAEEVVSIPTPRVHALRNESGEPVHMLVEFRPALDMETFLETMAGLARDGKTNKAGNPNLFQLAVIGDAFKREAYNAKIPLALQRMIVPLLALIGRALGYHARYDKYSGPA
jgi:quercetin dioxygenase-like cupin family protein